MEEGRRSTHALTLKDKGVLLCDHVQGLQILHIWVQVNSPQRMEIKACVAVPAGKHAESLVQGFTCRRKMRKQMCR